jgi:hypothetical protein
MKLNDVQVGQRYLAKILRLSACGPCDRAEPSATGILGQPQCLAS